MSSSSKGPVSLTSILQQSSYLGLDKTGAGKQSQVW